MPRGSVFQPKKMSPTAQVAILAGVAAGTVIAVVGTFLWAGAWDALAVVFVAPILVFITAIVIAVNS
jgi:hypothetical protein